MALSVKNILGCMGFTGQMSVVGNLFGYSMVPRQLSLRRQLELMHGKHLHLNLILVADEDFAWADWCEIFEAVQITREIYEKEDLGVGRLRYYGIPKKEAGSLAVVDSLSEAKDLTEEWTVDNNNIDVFVVRKMNGADGWSAVGGSCDKDSKGKMTGSVVSLNGNSANSGNTFAHEIGHYLGLDHISTQCNFIGNNGGSNSCTGILTWQGNKMKTHCFIRSGCPG